MTFCGRRFHNRDRIHQISDISPVFAAGKSGFGSALVQGTGFEINSRIGKSRGGSIADSALGHVQQPFDFPAGKGIHNLPLLQCQQKLHQRPGIGTAVGFARHHLLAASCKKIPLPNLLSVKSVVFQRRAQSPDKKPGKNTFRCLPEKSTDFRFADRIAFSKMPDQKNLPDNHAGRSIGTRGKHPVQIRVKRCPVPDAQNTVGQPFFVCIPEGNLVFIRQNKFIWRDHCGTQKILACLNIIRINIGQSLKQPDDHHDFSHTSGIVIHSSPVFRIQGLIRIGEIQHGYPVSVCLPAKKSDNFGCKFLIRSRNFHIGQI